MNEYRRCSRCGMLMDSRDTCQHCGAAVTAEAESGKNAVLAKRMPIYKVMLLIVGVIVLIIVLLFALLMLVRANHKEEDAESFEESVIMEIPSEKETETETPSETIESSVQTGKEVADLGAESGIYDAGEYHVGTDFTAGTYIAVEKSSSGLVITASADEEEEQEYYCYPWVRGSVIFTVEDGQYLHATNCYLYNAEKVDLTLDPFRTPGMFRVGIDVEPGTYDLAPYSEYGPYNCEVYSNVTSSGPIVVAGRVDGMDTAGRVTEESTVTLQEGEILYMRGCILE